MLQQAVDHADPVEPSRHGEAPRDSGGLEPADLLHPPDVDLQVRAARGQRVQAVLGAPGEVAAQVGLGVVTGRRLGSFLCSLSDNFLPKVRAAHFNLVVDDHPE